LMADLRNTNIRFFYDEYGKSFENEVTKHSFATRNKTPNMLKTQQSGFTMNNMR